jgi:hypothetical protein
MPFAPLPPTEEPESSDSEPQLPDDRWTDAFTTIDYTGVFVGAVAGFTAAVSGTLTALSTEAVVVSITVLFAGLTLNRSVSGVRSRFGLVPLPTLPVLLVYVGGGTVAVIAVARRALRPDIAVTRDAILNLLTLGSVGVAALYLTVIGWSGLVLWLKRRGGFPDCLTR